VPAGVTIAAASAAGPLLLGSNKVILWTVPADRHYPQTPWVLADVKRGSYPFKSVAAQQTYVQKLLSEGYRITFQDDGWLVLHRGD